ncbi:hypothetical protein TIFTF001_047934 [Ficus carica]|uniref:Uncharacterized protein n=1 Tax=Ficus carica TaxID=3494 RepID=A0AA87ZMJ4_FICCA|nr:hypothetical protein TIFTF001_047934 [Ficus carica]
MFFYSLEQMGLRTSLKGFHGERKLREYTFDVKKKKHSEEGQRAEPDIKWRRITGKMASDEETALLLLKALLQFSIL